MAECSEAPANERGVLRSNALQFVVLMGVVSLFADVTYEGARSITGPFLQILGASAFWVGAVAGFGELVGYALRLVSGYISDRTRRYWTVTFIGYGVNLLAVPLLAFAGRWEVAAALIILERFGKAIRTPARDAMLSHATEHIGHGWGFGIHEALDSIGGVSGPLVVAAILYLRKGAYQTGFAVLLVPALVALAMLVCARRLYPPASEYKSKTPKLATRGFERTYWIYLAAVACVAAGYADWALIAYHMGKTKMVPPEWIPIYYAIAMLVNGTAALVLGRLFDRVGVAVLIVSVVLSTFFAPLAFSTSHDLAIAGIILWGVGMAAEGSVMRAVIAKLVPSEKRGAAYGVFNTGYGVAWFAGSAAMGALYDWSVTALIVFSMAMQLAAIPLLYIVKRPPVSPAGPTIPAEKSGVIPLTGLESVPFATRRNFLPGRSSA